MRKQISFALFVTLCILACGRSTKKEVIFGEWGIFVSNDAYCNACPTISFKQDQTGVIRSPDSSILEVLKWGINDSKLKIYGVEEKINSIIPDGNYSIELTTNKEYKELRLREVKRDFYYTLRRH
ncbi:MAG TPA: hypothetical protein VNS32_02430 [Flavisolibacter sp.]|nr:hypothetical protein [Flavisolibacter sp.]